MIWFILIAIVGLIIWGLLYLLWTALCVAMVGVLQIALYFLAIIVTIVVAVYAGTYWLLTVFVGENNSDIAALATFPIGTAILAALCLLVAKRRGWKRARLVLAMLLGFAIGVFTLTFATPNPFAPNVEKTDLASNRPTATPISEADARREALRRHPDLAIAHSKFNSAFVARYNLYRQQKPDYFKNPSWPITLSEEVAQENSAK